MTVRERMLLLHLAEKLEKNPEYASKIGVRVRGQKAEPEAEKEGE